MPINCLCPDTCSMAATVPRIFQTKTQQKKTQQRKGQ